MARLYAILSDIHANWPALQAVENDARVMAKQEKIKPDDLHFICLGDVVDYGPEPMACITWVQQWADLVIRGNHDTLVATDELPHGLNPDYWPVTFWTRQMVNSKKFRGIYRNWRPDSDPGQAASAGLEAFVLFHSNLVRKDDYIKGTVEAQANLAQLPNPIQYGLFGHTHHQGYFRGDATQTKMFLACPAGTAAQPAHHGWQPASAGTWQPLPDKSWERALFNPGSVGQPRWHAALRGAGLLYQPHAAYMLLHLNGNGPGQFQFRQVDYNIAETIRLLREQVHWPELTPEPPSDQGFGPRPERTLGQNIYYQETNPFSAQPIAERLRHLIEETLIPTLERGW